jgi:hypothetical protein
MNLRMVVKACIFRVLPDIGEGDPFKKYEKYYNNQSGFRKKFSKVDIHNITFLGLNPTSFTGCRIAMLLGLKSRQVAIVKCAVPA